MTYSELTTEFDVLLDAVSNSSAPGFTAAERDIFFNKGQDKLIEELFLSSNYFLLKEILDTETATTGQLTAYSTGTITNAEQYTIADLNTDFMFFVNAELRMTRSAAPVIAVAEWVPCDLIDKADAQKFAYTTINKPLFQKPKIFLEETKVVIIYDAYTTSAATGDEFKFEFIRRPVRINNSGSVTCELHDKLHKNVVEKAVELAWLSVNPQQAAANVQLNTQI